MKKTIFLLAAVASLSAFTFIKINITPISIGTSMPKGEDTLINVMNDKPVTLNSQKKKNGLLVMFSCNTCPFVIANEKRIAKVQHDIQKLEIGMVIINSNEGYRDGDDSKSAMKDYGSRQKFLTPYLLDVNSVFADAFGATRTPECFLFNKDGNLVYQGAIDDSPKDESAVQHHYLMDAMTALVAGKDIEVKTTVSTGCGIKRKQ
ncbi:MAG: redoxin family protein [Bacteroidetes bacterium]|nr:redoxin family protein [Bacteroidota bacterium]